MATFPPELVDLIVSHLHPRPLVPGRAENLLRKAAARNVANCALVCRAWVPSSRRVLFYRLHIIKITAHAFAKLLRKPERLTFLPFIRELQFSHGISQDRWMSTVLPRILKHIPSIITISLSYDNVYDIGPDISFPALHAAQVTLLVIEAEAMPDLAPVLQIIVSFPALVDLKLWVNESHKQTLPEQVVSLRPAPTLRHLDVCCRSPASFLQWMQASGRPISSLQIHHLLPDPSVDRREEWQSAFRYIESLATSLTSLSLIINTYFAPIELDHGFLKANKSLKDLSLQGYPDRIADILNRMDPCACFDSVALNLPTTVVVDGASILPLEESPHSELNFPTWDGSMDARLSNCCRKLSIGYESNFKKWTAMEAEDPVCVRFDELCTRTVEMLPQCAAKGILTHSIVPSPAKLRYPCVF